MFSPLTPSVSPLRGGESRCTHKQDAPGARKPNWLHGALRDGSRPRRVSFPRIVVRATPSHWAALV